MTSSSKYYYTDRSTTHGYAYTHCATFSSVVASQKKVVASQGTQGGKQGSMPLSASDTSLSTTVVVAQRAFSPELFQKRVTLINSQPPAEEKEQAKGKEKEKEKEKVKTKSTKAPAPAAAASSLASSSQSSSSSTALAHAPTSTQLHPKQIQALLIEAGKDSDILTVWVAHQARFDTGNYSTIFARFTELQSKKKGANDSYADVLRGMVGGVIDCINDFRYMPLSNTIRSFDAIKCGGQKLIRTFEKFIMKDDALASFKTDTISSIASSYAYHRISGLAAESFLLFLNTEVTQNRDADAQALGSMLKVFSKIGLQSSAVKSAFKTTQVKIAEGGATLLKAAKQETIATMAHALSVSQKDSAQELLTLEETIMKGSESGGCVLSTWVKDEKVGSNFSKLLHAFAKQGVGSADLYTAFEAVLTDDTLAKFEMSDLIKVSWALVVAGRFTAAALPTMMGMLVGAFESGALDLTGDEGKKQLEMLRWIKLSLTFEQYSTFEWGSLGDEINKYKGEAPSGSLTQTAVFDTLKAIYGKDHVTEEHPVEGLDVDIFIDHKGTKGAAIEVLGPSHYVDGASCTVLNEQTKFRLRLLKAILGADAVATISTKQWDTQKSTTLEGIQKQIA